jgi:hypothetical protein
LKSLGTYKPSRFQKQFKEARIAVLDDLVKVLNHLNRKGKMNDFDISRLDMPVEVSIE